MRPAAARLRAEQALTVARELLRGRSEIFGSGLTRVGGKYVVMILTTRQVDDLPDEIEGVPLIQELGDPPQLWE